MGQVDEAVVSASPGETRIALLGRGEALEFIIDRGDPARGDVIEGRVVEVAPALGAAFVSIGDSEPGFLGKPKGVSTGATVLVEVTVAPRPGKGAELRLAAAGARPLRRSPLARALADYPGIARVTVDDRPAQAEIRSLFAAATYDPFCWTESGAADAFDEALAPRVALADGASLSFSETPAATMIDVDGAGLAAASTNAAALPAVARHLRLRGIGGHILVDVIPTRDRRMLAKLVESLRAAVADDSAPVQVAGHTPLGMLELTRRRSGPSLAEMMWEPSSAIPTARSIALDGIRALLREAAARPAAALSLVLPPRAVSVLRSQPAVIDETSRRLGRPLLISERPGLDLFAIEEAVR